MRKEQGITMGIAERREREKEQRRNMILDAAEALFFTKGVENTTMDDIAEKAELSKGTLYLYFKNRDDIFHGIHLRGLEILKGMFEQAIKKGDSGIEKVREIGNAYFRFSQEYPDYFYAMINFVPKEFNLDDPTSNLFHCHHCSEEVLAIVARAVQAGIDDGSIRPDLDPMLTAYLLWGQSTGIIQIMQRHGEHLQDFHGIQPDRMIPAMFDLIDHALKSQDQT